MSAQETGDVVDDQIADINEPGVYDLAADEYHSDPVEGGSLSSSGARRLLPPSTPAHYAYERTHGRPDTAAFDFGHAAHRMVLGAGQDTVVVDADDWRTKAAREVRDLAHADGLTPLLAKEHERVVAMAAALRNHPTAAALLDPQTGKPEQTLVWHDEDSGVWCRALLDWLPHPTTGRMIVVDYKTTVSADPDTFARSAATYGYHQQDAWYTAGVRALDLADDPAFVFIAQEKTSPYLVSVVELDATAKRIGAHLNRQALDVYAHCAATGEWSGYPTAVTPIRLPAWIENTYPEDTA